MTKAQETKSTSSLRPPTFLIGRDSRGNWVAQEQGGMCGGLFIDRESALKFARAENGNPPHAVVMVSGTLELTIAADPAMDSRVRRPESIGRERRVA
jgi:hypothetical protein